MDKIRFGIVGTNFISDWVVAGGRLDPRFEPVAVCSRKEETGRAFAEKHNIGKVFTSVEEMAQSGEIDAAYIASPNAFHARQSITAMNAGLHVLCEKPMASNAREVTEMISVARRNGVVLMEAMRTTLHPNFRVIRDNLWRLGTIRRYFSSFCQYSSRYDALKQGNVANAFKPELSNGAIMDIGVYCLYPMIALFGKPRSVISNVDMLSTGVDGQGSVIALYDGFDGVVIYSKIANSLLPTEIQGEEGVMTIDRINAPHRVIFTPRDKSLDPIDLSADANLDDYYYEIKEFIDLILSGRHESSINSLANSLATIELIDQLRHTNGITFPADHPHTI